MTSILETYKMSPQVRRKCGAGAVVGGIVAGGGGGTLIAKYVGDFMATYKGVEKTLNWAVEVPAQYFPLVGLLGAMIVLTVLGVAAGAWVGMNYGVWQERHSSRRRKVYQR